MKAAVLHQFGTNPTYQNFSDPVADEAGQVLVQVKAASIKNVDKARAKGTHYHSHHQLPTVVGIDGVGLFPDGQRVYVTNGLTGMMAQWAVALSQHCIPIPDSVDDVTAAALPNPGLSAWFTLAYRAAIQPGETVLIMGATGVTGKMAIQLAKQLGAGKVIATGRNEQILQTLPTLGADVVISLKQSEEDLKKALLTQVEETPFDIVIDYLWGAPAELVLEVLTGHNLTAEAHRTRYIQVGEMAGSTITLPAASLRSSAIELYGVGGGSISKEVMKQVPGQILPQLFQFAAEGKLSLDTLVVPLQNIEQAWQQDEAGKRIVVVPD